LWTAIENLEVWISSNNNLNKPKVYCTIFRHFPDEFKYIFRIKIKQRWLTLIFFKTKSNFTHIITNPKEAKIRLEIS